ncbi:MAG: YbhB/YbcL family Raf kinase inhibitor-like protein [Geminicoccaceae bacterium]
MSPRISSVVAAVIVMTGAAGAMATPPLSVTIDGLSVRGTLPDAAAFCRLTSATTVAPGPNQSLGVQWSRGPNGTRSYALTMVDPDVPQDLSAMNHADREIAAGAPRMTFTHWVLTDIPDAMTHLLPGADSEGQATGGKQLGRTTHGVRGQNGYASFLQDGAYGGYDGPCPPWNDRRPHRYVVRIYALDLATLDLSGPFTRGDMETAMAGHVLASGEASATYTLNPNLHQ